jgi:DNA-damage-inducible protein D
MLNFNLEYMKNENGEKQEFGGIALFKGQKIRRVIFQGEWWFSVVDVCGVLTESPTPRQYWEKIKTREFDDFQLSPNWGQLKLTAEDGKMRETDCANTEGLFRIIQSIPSPKAEPFKRWLAKVGYERVKEIEDPELATKRTRALYKLKGYSDSWIEKRMRGIAIREELTDEWQNRGARDKKDYEILTAEISKATFGLTPNQYKKVKGLEKENLRDHMNDLELIFNMLGERATTEIHRVEDSQGLGKLKFDSQAGGKIAGDARKNLEKRLKRSVVSKDNFLTDPESQKRLLNKKI